MEQDSNPGSATWDKSIPSGVVPGVPNNPSQCGPSAGKPLGLTGVQGFPGLTPDSLACLEWGPVSHKTPLILMETRESLQSMALSAGPVWPSVGPSLPALGSLCSLCLPSVAGVAPLL